MGPYLPRARFLPSFPWPNTVCLQFTIVTEYRIVLPRQSKLPSTGITLVATTNLHSILDYYLTEYPSVV